MQDHARSMPAAARNRHGGDFINIEDHDQD